MRLLLKNSEKIMVHCEVEYSLIINNETIQTSDTDILKVEIERINKPSD